MLVGPASASRTVDKALAQGGDRSVHLADDGLAGSDVIATSKALAALLERDSYDLVLFGQQASDAECYVMAAAVAERLRPALRDAGRLPSTCRRDRCASSARPRRATTPSSCRCRPCVSVSDAINEPRYPSLPAIMGAKRKPHEVLSLADAGIDAGAVGAGGARTTVDGLSTPPARGDGVKIEDDGDAAEKILAFLVERKLVV